jgi:hypothetical protein
MRYNIFTYGGSWEFSKFLCQIRRRNYFEDKDMDSNLSFRIVKLTRHDSRNS